MGCLKILLIALLAFFGLFFYAGEREVSVEPQFIPIMPSLSTRPPVATETPTLTANQMTATRIAPTRIVNEVVLTTTSLAATVIAQSATPSN